MSRLEKNLVLAGPRPKRLRIGVVGKHLEQTTWNAKGVAKTTKKAFASADDARVGFHKAVRAKLRADYVCLGESQERGAVMLEAFAPGGGSGQVLDLSPDGRFIVTASITSQSNFGAKLELVEVATGARRTVLQEPAGERQNFLHAALFDRAGTGIYLSLRDHTEHVEIATGTRRVVARGGGFNPHVVRPSFDRDRRRLVVFAEGSIVRVLDEREQSVLDVSTASPVTECRAACLSPSGRFLALYIASRGIIYSHDDAKHDTTCEIRIWDLESRSLWETVTVTEQVDELGFTPAETELVVTWYYARGPVAIAIPSGVERWRISDSVEPSALARTYAWAYSPNGKQLALGGEGLRLVDPATWRDVEIAAGVGRTTVVAFSADGKRLAAAVGGTAYVHVVG